MYCDEKAIVLLFPAIDMTAGIDILMTFMPEDVFGSSSYRILP